MMNDVEKSDSVIVAMKSANKGTAVPAESMEPKDRAQGEFGKPKHVPDSESGKRDTGGRPDTAICTTGATGASDASP